MTKPEMDDCKDSDDVCFSGSVDNNGARYSLTLRSSSKYVRYDDGELVYIDIYIISGTRYHSVRSAYDNTITRFPSTLRWRNPNTHGDRLPHGVSTMSSPTGTVDRTFRVIASSAAQHMRTAARFLVEHKRVFLFTYRMRVVWSHTSLVASGFLTTLRDNNVGRI